jgi:hypothetical protein
MAYTQKIIAALCRVRSGFAPRPHPVAAAHWGRATETIGLRPETVGFWTLALGGSVMGAAGLLGWLRPPGRLWRLLRDALGVMFGIAALAAFAWEAPPTRLAAASLAFTLLWLIGCLSVSAPASRFREWIVRIACVPPVLWTAALVGGPITAISFARQNEKEHPASAAPGLGAPATATRAVAWQRLPWKRQSVSVVTDAGRSIPLYTLAIDPSEFEKLRMRGQQLDAAVSQELAPTDGMIRTAPPDPGYDCHGWIFTGGRHLIDGQDVDAILQDNHYYPVHDPQPHDLAIYRDDAGIIRHSGIVVAVSDAKGPLLESKWGFIGRYISPAANHMYGQACTFYRSSRAGHHLRAGTSE